MNYIYSFFLRILRFIYPAANLKKINKKLFLFKAKNFEIFDNSLIRFNQYKALGDKKIYNLIDRYSFFPHIYINLDSLVVDIGANIGEFGVGSNYYGCKDYIAIEPTSIAFKCLKKNILKKKNNFNSIKLFNKLLLDKKKLVNFYTNYSWSRDNSIYKNNSLPDLQFKIKKYKTVTLDSLIFNKIKHHKNIFIKMYA
jgi:FkbM family methyltransferase